MAIGADMRRKTKPVPPPDRPSRLNNWEHSEKLSVAAPLRMSEVQARNVELMLYRTGMLDRSALIRWLIDIAAPEVEAAWYLAQIGAGLTPTESALVARIAVAMEAECGAIVAAHITAQDEEAFGREVAA